MYNEAIARAVLADQARKLEAALFLKSLDGHEPARSRGRAGRSPIAYVRDIATSALRIVTVRPWRTKTDDDSCVPADT